MTGEVAGLVGPRARIGTMTLVGGGLSRLREKAAPLGALWLVLGGLLSGIEAVALALGLETASLGFTAGGLAHAILIAVVTGGLSAVGLRILLDRPGRWRDVDPGFIQGAGICCVGALGFGLWSLALSETLSRPPVPFLGIALGLGAVAMAYVMLRLTLWPIARLMGRVDVGVAESWRMMRRATRGYVLASVLLAAPFMFLGFGAVAVAGPDGELPPVLETLFEAVFAGYSVVSLAVTATLYELRASRMPTLAEVFA